MDSLTKVFVDFVYKVKPVLERGEPYTLLHKERELLKDLEEGRIPQIELIHIILETS